MTTALDICQRNLAAAKTRADAFREEFPETAAMVERVRAVFPNAKLKAAVEGGKTTGAAGDRLAMDMEARKLVRGTDPETSVQAALRVAEYQASHEGLIYGALRDAGAAGLTKDEIAVHTRMDAVAVARRLSSMEARRLIGRTVLGIDPVRYQTRENAKGNACAVWRLA